MSKKFKTAVLILILLVTVASFAIHPFGKIKTPPALSHQQLFTGAQIDPPVFSILQRSCQNCHSEQTTWPWYSYVAPVSWLVEKDVRDGRSHFNMSRWSEYNPDDRIQILAGIATNVKNKDMPLPQYVLMHRDARLSDGDIELVYQWARAERKRLKGEQGKN